MWVRSIRFILAPPIILAGLFFIFLPFGFATMLDGDPDKPLGWPDYLRIVITSRDGVGTLAIGMVAIILGIYIASPGRSATPGPHR